MSADEIRDALQMEDNYKEIHKKAILDRIYEIKEDTLVPDCFLFPFMERRYRKLLESFREKRIDFQRGKYIDEVVTRLQIPLPNKIVPSEPDRFHKRGDLAYWGINFKEAPIKGVRFEYFNWSGSQP